MQKVLTMMTERNTIRADVMGWGNEDGNAVLDTWAMYRREERIPPGGKSYNHPNDIPVGMISGSIGKHRVPFYPTVLHALGDGWKLLAPPIEFEEDRFKEDEHGNEVKYKLTCYEWWLVKD
jgi:hypothetical protein